MKRALFGLFLMLVTLTSSVRAAPSVRDARGVAITIRGTPRRIVSLAPGATEMLFALALGKSVVGDTTFCDYPPAAKGIAKIGDVHTNIERVLSLRPDLIVATDANRGAVARLTALRLPVFMISPTSFAATEQSLALLGQVTGHRTQAQAVVGQMEAKRRRAGALAARDGRHPRVLVVVGLNPLWTAGTGTFIDDILVQAGAVNVAGSLAQYAPFSKERLLTHPPDMILASPREAAAMRADPLYRTLPAVRDGRFFSVEPDVLTRPGPRLADALLLVARALHSGAPGVK